MLFINTKSQQQNFAQEALVKHLYVLTQENKPVDRYGEYLLKGDKPKDRLSNSRNLFDDSNRNDAQWLKIARAHLIRSSQVPAPAID